MNRRSLQMPEKASNETPRNINRRLILDLIRKLQPISRADLARHSGLQRSTVSLIVEELIEQDWVVEGHRERLPVGRRPTLLQLSSRRGVLVVDVHPGRAILAIGNIDGSLGGQTVIDLSGKSSDPAIRIATGIRRVIKDNPRRLFTGIGISVPGGVDDAHQLIFAPNLEWSQLDLRSALERETGLSVEIENAANVCLLGELWFRTARDARDLALIAVAEGIGVAVMSNWQLVRGMHGLAGELGHLTLDETGPKCHCGGRGCWETYASNRAAERYYRDLHGRGPYVGFEKILQLANSGDRKALLALEEMAKHLARGLRTLVTAYSPEAIIVSGELTAQWELFHPILDRALRRSVLAGSRPQLVPSQDGAMNRLRGGIALVLQH